MKITKKSERNDEKTRLVFDIFDKIITRINHPWKFEMLEFLIGEINSVFVKNDRAAIIINYNDSLIQDMDRKGIISLILHSLYHIIIPGKYNLPEIPHFVEDIMINREMINDGYDDLVFYISYLYLLKKRQVSNLEECLKINIPWLSFYGLDNYNSEFLKDMLIKIKNKEHFKEKTKRLIESMKKDLTIDKNINYTLNVYEVMLCR